MNFLESLAAEWYGYNEYFVRTNIHVGKRPLGGYKAEIDVLAYSPIKEELVHLEMSSDADSWPEREQRMRKKFDLPHAEYEKAFNVKVDKVRKIAICGFSFASRNIRWGEIEVKSVREFFNEVYAGLSHKSPMSEAVPESYPLLRAIQMSAWATKKPRVARKP